MNRHRHRGLRRRFRQHQRRAAPATLPDLARLTSHHYDHRKLGLAPWYLADQPPLAFRRLWATRLLTDFWQWHAQLSARGEPFYLAIWLYEPHFGESQLVAGIAERNGQYARAFNSAPDAPLPPAYRNLPGFADLRWSVGLHEWVLDEDEFAELGTRGRHRPHYRFTTLDGERYVAVRRGRVWVGQAPG